MNSMLKSPDGRGPGCQHLRDFEAARAGAFGGVVVVVDPGPRRCGAASAAVIGPKAAGGPGGKETQETDAAGDPPAAVDGTSKEAERAGKTPFGRSRFFERLTEERAQTVSPDRAEGRFDFAPGDQGFLDISGKPVPVTTRTGVVMSEILVGCLRLSDLTFAEAVSDQTLRSQVGRTSACARPGAA